MIATEHVPHDAALPRLALALDPVRMREELTAHLTRGATDRDAAAISIESCRIERVRYKPGRSCLVCYALDLRVEGEGTSEQLLCARMYPPNESVSRYRKAAQAPLAATGVGAPLLHLPDLDMVVWAFPNERKLTGLERLTNGAWLQARTLPALVPQLHGPDWRLERCAHRIVHYVPEHTCTVQATLDVRRADGMRQRSVVYGKAYYDGTGARVGDAMRRLWSSRAVQSGALGIARPLAYEPRDRVLWQEGLEGATLEQAHPDDRIPERVLRRVAGAIAALHGSPVARLPSVGPADVLAELRTRAAVIGDAQPGLRERLDRVVRALSGAAPGAAAAATLHGDLHPKNLFLIGERVCLIDLDSVRRGPAELDLASWLACMLYRACLRGEPSGSVQAAVGSFVNLYERERGAPIDRRALDWYTAAALVSERAYRVLSRLKDGRLEILDDLLELALRAVAGSGLHANTERRSA
jgi:thiamine kinase-like enzyme